MTATLEYSRYEFQGNDELCLKVGGHHTQSILLIPPLFDEMNRMRRMLLDVMRLLDANGIGSVLPDLPGTNESLFPQQQASLAVWRQALRDCSNILPKCQHIASFRGGCLIDDFAKDMPKWRLSPAKGNALLRTMMRTRMASDKEAGLSTNMVQLTEEAQQGAVNLAGNSISASMFSELQEAVPSLSDDVRTAQLETSAHTGDIKLPGSALWLRAEPDEDLLLSGAIATNLVSWISS